MVSAKHLFFVVVGYLSGLQSDSSSNCQNCLTMAVEPSTDVLVNQTVSVYGNFSTPHHNGTTVSLFCKGPLCVDVINCKEDSPCSNLTAGNGSKVVGPFTLRPLNPGVITLYFKCDSKEINVANAFANINVGKALWIFVFSEIAGWVYFFAWSVSFYPQIWTNFKRKSVIGLSFDFLGLNLTGFIFYSVYNICLYYVPIFQQEYQETHPQQTIPVVLNDVAFSVHAVFAVVLTVIQCFLYERGAQKVSLVVIGCLLFFWISAGVLLIVTLCDVITKLTYIYCLSYAKLAITLIKYAPQAVYNYSRQSTVGWSIGNILLDFMGGALSNVQLFLQLYNNGQSWTSICTNFSKFGLGVISILFDILFIVQHYCLYPTRESKMLTDTDAIVSDSNESTEDDVKA